jgi:WD40 repeat protein
MWSPFAWPDGSILTPDGRFITAYRNGKHVRVDVAAGAVAGPLADSVSEWSADGRTAVAANGYVRVWNVAGGVKTFELRKVQFSDAFGLYQRRDFGPVSLSADGKLLAVGAEADSRQPGELAARVWDVGTGEQVCEVKPEQNRLVAVRLSPDGKTLATFGQHNDPARKFDARNPDGWPEQAVQLWDVGTGRRLARLAVGGVNVVSVTFSPDGSVAAVSAGNGVVTLHEARTGAEKHRLVGRQSLGQIIRFSPDGAAVAAVTTSGEVQRWAVADGKFLGTTEPPVIDLANAAGIRVRDFVWPAADRAVVWAVVGSLAVVWEAPSGKLLSPTLVSGKVLVSAKRVASVAFTADGKQVLVAGDDHRVHRWDAVTGELLGPVVLRPGHPASEHVPVVRLLPGGSRAVAADIGTQVFDLDGGGERCSLPPPGTGGLPSVRAASADGTKAVTWGVGQDGSKETDRFEVWDLGPVRRLGALELPDRATYKGITVRNDGMRVAVSVRAGDDLRVTGYDPATAKPLGTVTVKNGWRAEHLPGADSVLVATNDPAAPLVVADYGTGKVVRSLPAAPLSRGPLSPGAQTFSPDGALVALPLGVSLPEQGEYQVWVYSWPDGKLLHTLTGLPAAATAVAFAPDGKTLATGLEDTTVLLWDLGGAKK